MRYCVKSYTYTSMNAYTEYETMIWDGNSAAHLKRDLIGEEPLSIRIQGKPYSVVLRTPGDEIPHVAGFCLGEGIVDSPEDLTTIAFCDGAETNVVTVTLKDSRRTRISDLLERRGYISQTSCGICGKELVEDLRLILEPVSDDLRLNVGHVLKSLLAIGDHQPLRRRTHASHAAAIYNPAGELLAVAEDVGRHNALDKAIGKLFLDRRLDQAAFLTLSSRISYELVKKAVRARISVILGVSRPTTLAVDLAERLNMTLACLAENDGLYVFCGKKRLI